MIFLRYDGDELGLEMDTGSRCVVALALGALGGEVFERGLGNKIGKTAW